MIDWLRPLWLMFYAPTRGLGEARDRAPLLPAVLLYLLAQVAFSLYAQWDYLLVRLLGRGIVAIIAVFVQATSSLVGTALIFIPVTIIIANLFERRASIRLAIQQEYASVASAIFYALAASNIAAIPLAVLAKKSGWVASVSEQYVNYIIGVQQKQPELAGMIEQDMLDPQTMAVGFLLMLTLPFAAVLTLIAVRVVFRLSWLRSIVILLGSAFVMLVGAFMLSSVVGALLASPFILLLVFLLLRGYLGEASRAHRARASFKEHLEASTLNPADASAHYNLGLIHQQRKELDEAYKRFERAVEIDAEEVDAHYQLGRIARQQQKWSEAIGHFGAVVEREPAHAQHEIWREIGATYLSAGQFEDARDALERFLSHRTSDPEGLYLMGRAHAGLGDQREAAASMQACIEAVKTAPAYKYRTEKRWLNEAQEFIKSSH